MNMKKILGLVGLFAIGALAMIEPAMAATLGEKLQTMQSNQFDSVTKFVSGAMYIVGFVIGAAALLKFREYSQEPERNSIGTPIGYLIVAALCIGLPSVIGLTKDTTGLTNTNTSAKGATATIQ